MNFTHLHVHTEYSLLDGSNKINEYVARVKELGMNSAAITDHGVMFGCIDFYRAAKAAGIKPILGCEVYVAPGSRFDREIGQAEDRYYHLVLLAENNHGYENLMKIVSKAFVDGFYYKPRVDMDLLQEYHEGIIALSACLAGEVAKNITRGMYEEAKSAALRYEKIFGKGNFFLELQDHGIPQQQRVNQQLLRMSQETGIALVATNDVHYTYDTDAEAHDILLCVQTRKLLSDENRMRYEGGQYYVKSPEEMAELFPYIPEALENTQKIADRCEVEIEFGVTKLPKFDVPAPYTSWEYLNKLCYDGLKERYSGDLTELEKRLEYELGVIKTMGYVDYFLIVWDFIRFARDHDIMVGPGRGSAAGSLVSYTLGITKLDPIKYNLLFERFLNPERVSMPDIDVDFCYVRRPEVIDYVTRKYGKDRVAQIVTFGTMAARGAIRDVGRALSIPYNEVDAVAKQVPNELHITIDKALKVNADLRKMYEDNPTVKNLIDTARKLEGMPRHASTHAAGVVITKDPVDTYVPLARNDEQMVTQYTMVTLEELGLLKMDFLGLRNLTVIADAEKLIHRHTPDFSIEKAPVNDPATYAMLAQGKTMGVFQMESAGMTNVAMQLRPHSIEDITALVALYRPGPMQSIPRYIECKHHPEKVTYKHPLLEPILSVTYGCMVYQEQVMQVFQSLAGYSLGKADMVRRAMSKKKFKELEKERVNFIRGNEELGIDGAVKRGVPEAVAASIFDEILDFANYAFNKAHAVCYAVVAFRTAYLKCHYPCEYMAALLTSVLDSSGKISEYIAACRDMGIQVLPPDINESEDGFSVSGKNIRFGLAAIKNVGRSFMKQLVAEREQGGPFASLSDFCERMYDRELNKRALESLIKAGVFDATGARRSQLLAVYERVADGVAQSRRKNLEGQLDLFGMGGAEQQSNQVTLPNIPELAKSERLSMEKETTGLYLSGHPMDEHRALARRARAAEIKRIVDDLSGENEQPEFRDGMTVRLACVITGVRLKSTKSGSMMAYVTVEDISGAIELVVFPKTLQQSGSYIREDQAVLLQGRIDAREDEAPKIVVSAAYPLTEEQITALENNGRQSRPVFDSREAAAKSDERLYVKVPSMQCEACERVKQELLAARGTMPVVFYAVDTGKKLLAPRGLWVQKNLQVVDKLRFILGEKNVIIK